jgi:hypothetical protein
MSWEATAQVATGACTRTQLQSAVTSYIDAQTRGRAAALPVGRPLKVIENGFETTIDKGILRTPLKIDFHRSLLDVETCGTFTEIIVTDKAHPYVLGVHLRLAGGKISHVETLVADEDDWLFSANNYFKYSPGENWGVIPKERQDDRKTLVAAANAYFDLFKDSKDKANHATVPWGRPCHRIEGGMRTGKGQPNDTCDTGVPSGVDIVNRRFIVDTEIGSVAGLSVFGPSKLPDSHLFRLERGRIRYIHTITVCRSFNCGYELPVELQRERQAAR